MILAIILLILGLFFLGFSANHLINTSVRIAQYFKVSALLIGLTILAMGTSAPELFLSGMAALNGSGSLSVGNVIGSNIFNLGFILGLSAIVTPIFIQKKLVYRDGAFLVFITCLILCMLWDQHVTRWEGVILLTLLVCYNGYLRWKKESPEEGDITIEPPKVKNFAYLFGASVLLCLITVEDIDGVLVANYGISTYASIFLTVIVIGFLISTFLKRKKNSSENKLGMCLNFTKLISSLGVLVLASDLVVAAATYIAQQAGVSEWAIGATIVAAGTSLPEIAATLAAIIKKRYDMGVGNVIGSDIFNVLGIIGISSVVTPLNLKPSCLLPEGCDINFFTMIFRDNIFSVVLLILTLIMTLALMRTNWKLSKGEGLFLFMFALLRMIFEIKPDFFIHMFGG